MPRPFVPLCLTNWLFRSELCPFKPLIPKNVIGHISEVHPFSLTTTYFARSIVIVPPSPSRSFKIPSLQELFSYTIWCVLRQKESDVSQVPSTSLVYSEDVGKRFTVVHRLTPPEVHNIDTTGRMSNPIFPGAFSQCFMRICIFPILDIRADRRITNFLTLERGAYKLRSSSFCDIISSFNSFSSVSGVFLVPLLKRS